jgi:alginate O-acetyltransferase complex protein AlgI
VIGYALLAVLLLLIIEIGEEYFSNVKVLSSDRVVVRYAGYFFLIISILLLGVVDGGQFIYFQF